VTRKKPPPPEGLSPEESRYVDGEAPPDAARRLERQLAADPERADRLEAYRDAMDVWREDAQHTARTVDPRGALAERVLESVTRDAPPSRATNPMPRWYAAAAVLLIAVGIGGTVIARRTHPAPHRPPELADIEEAVLDLVLESPELSPRLTNLKEGR
jgi:anti-sigma factor RsiW